MCPRIGTWSTTQAATKLEELHISGVNLTKLPPALGGVYVVQIDDLKLEQKLSRGLNWPQTYSLILRNSNLTDEVLATWLIPNTRTIDLIGSKVTPDAVEAMHKKWPSLNEIILVPQPTK